MADKLSKNLWTVDILSYAKDHPDYKRRIETPLKKLNCAVGINPKTRNITWELHNYELYVVVNQLMKSLAKDRTKQLLKEISVKNRSNELKKKSKIKRLNRLYFKILIGTIMLVMCFPIIIILFMI